MNANSKEIVTDFIDKIWNENQFKELEKYLHPEFTDHSLPPGLPVTKEGLKLWIIGTGKSFQHKTVIEEIVCEGNKVIIKIKMLLKHIGKWRDIDATEREIHTVGYRYFKLENNKIKETWSLLDGNAIENQLRETHQGCKIQE